MTEWAEVTDLDAAYANAEFIPEGARYPAQWSAAASAYRAARIAAGQARLGISYGLSERQAFDLFLPDGPPEGLMIFVHGGFWRITDRAVWSHLAEGARASGWAVALPSYDLCPAVRIADITEQITAAIARIAQEVAGPIVLAGHSAGGHLVARMCAPDRLPDAVNARLSHVMPISPLSDLRPLLRTSMNKDFQMDEAAAWAESPLAQPVPEVPVTVWVGGDERPAFLDQARWLAQHWGCAQVVTPDEHHFNVIAPLVDPASAMVRTLLGKG